MIPKSMLEELEKRDLKAQSKGLEEKLHVLDMPKLSVPPKQVVGDLASCTVAKAETLIVSTATNAADLVGEVLKLGVKGTLLGVCAIANVINDTLEAKPKK